MNKLTLDQLSDEMEMLQAARRHCKAFLRNLSTQANVDHIVAFQQERLEAIDAEIHVTYELYNELKKAN